MTDWAVVAAQAQKAQLAKYENDLREFLLQEFETVEEAKLALDMGKYKVETVDLPNSDIPEFENGMLKLPFAQRRYRLYKLVLNETL